MANCGSASMIWPPIAKLYTPVTIAKSRIQIGMFPPRTYAQAAEILGVSRERVYQLTALVTKLPPQIKDFLASTEDPAVLRFFSERRLRPLTMLTDRAAQMAQFAELVAEAKGV